MKKINVKNKDLTPFTDGGDLLSGQEGDDVLYGWHGDDILAGGLGDDRIYGGAGNDTIEGDTTINWWYAYSPCAWKQSQVLQSSI